LYRHFENSDIEIPQDLQAHVSNGTAINSFLINGLGIDIIKPIVSEPIFIILQNDTKKIVVYEGTEMPTENITITDLRPQKEGTVIEIPICVTSIDKILTVLKVTNENGFNTTDKLTLKCNISHDKLITFKAFIQGIEIETEPLNPFANSSLTTEEIAEKKLLKSLYNVTKANSGRPPINMVKALAEFYVKMEWHLKAAETFETVQQLDPRNRYETSICYHYSNAGRKKLSDKWAEMAYQTDPTGTNAYNLALVKSDNGNFEDYNKLMEVAIEKNCDAALLVYGEKLLHTDKEKGTELISRAFNIWYNQFTNNTLSKNNYSRLIRASRQLGKMQIAQEVQNKKDNLNESSKITWYNPENTLTDSKIAIENSNFSTNSLTE